MRKFIMLIFFFCSLSSYAFNLILEEVLGGVGDAYTVKVIGNYARVVDRDGCKLNNVSDPKHPTLEGNLDGMGSAYGGGCS